MCCTAMCIVVTQGNILVYQGVRKNMSDQVTELSLIEESIDIKYCLACRHKMLII